LASTVGDRSWDVVSGDDDVKARQLASEISQKFYEDTENEIKIGVLAAVELPRAEVEVSSRRQDLLIAEANLHQRETSLKDALMRAPDPEVEAARIVPLDRIEVPKTEDLPALRELVAQALRNRPDVAVAKVRD